MSNTKLYLWIIALAATGGALRGVTENLWGNDSLLFILVDVGAWSALVAFAAHSCHRIGYRKAQTTYKARLDNLTAILPGHGPEWDTWLKGKRVGARSMQERAVALVDAADADAIQALPLIYDREWVEANEGEAP